MLPRRFRRSGQGGCGTAGPRPVLLCCYRFDETGCPARSFSTCPPTGGPCLKAFDGSRRDHCWSRRGAGLTPFRTTPSARASRRAASKQRPSIDLREDPRTLPRPGFIARPQPAAIEERGSDALPVRRDGGIVGRVLPAATYGRWRVWRGQEYQRVSWKYSDRAGRICSAAIGRCAALRRGAGGQRLWRERTSDGAAPS